jgi:hypothetical protein
MREHRERVIDQIAQLHECLSLISGKIEVYEGSLVTGESCIVAD